MGEIDSSAIQYLRMSTEHQRYSFENQAAVIAAYAVDRGLRIVRSYEDPGKSGLTLKGRKGLQQLLVDALSPSRDFSTVLVLDVSRWGRFQDPDQAAHYEYLCREAGVQVAYCGELFENDGGMVSTIVKHLKRVMAGEYSRELSTKVTRAKLRLARLGYRQGGGIPYGLRRLLISEDGTPRQILSLGQRKGLHTDRVRVILGPPEEQDVVRRIFKLYVHQGGSYSSVAEQLNQDEIPTSDGEPWRAGRIRYMIRNEIYMGYATFNKTTRVLRSVIRKQPRDEWIRVKVCEPIVRRTLFEKANRLANRNRSEYSDAHLLRRLKKLWQQHGYLSATLVDKSPTTPMFMTYLKHFGSMSRAYDLIGYTHHPRRKWRKSIGGFWTDEAIIEGVKKVWERNGYVSAALLKGDPTAPSPGTLRRRFGGVLACYAAAGLPATKLEVQRAAIATIKSQMATTRIESTIGAP